MPEEYIYAVTRVHNHEQGLLSEQDLQQLIAASTVPEAFRLLSDKGWGAPELAQDDTDALIAYETERTWALMNELVGDVEHFNVFRLANDFHNLKAAIKLAYSANEEKDQDKYFLKYGTVELETIIKAADEHNFSMLPEALALAGKQAYEALAHTGNGQACDIVIDRASLISIYDAAQNTDSELLSRYAQLKVDSANIKAAVRACLMGKSREFLERVVAPAGTVDADSLINAAADGMEAIYTLLSRGDYAGAVDELKQSLSAFERWCDNQLIELIKPQRYNYFTIEPLAAYVVGRENEIAMVRLILSAKINGLPADALRERLRDTYV